MYILPCILPSPNLITVEKELQCKLHDVDKIQH